MISSCFQTAAYKLRNSGLIPQSSFNWVFKAFNQNLSVSYSVRDFLFDGYDNDLMNVAHTATQIYPSSSLISSPFDKFAWFYKVNTVAKYFGTLVKRKYYDQHLKSFKLIV